MRLKPRRYDSMTEKKAGYIKKIYFMCNIDGSPFMTSNFSIDVKMRLIVASSLLFYQDKKIKVIK